MTIENQKSADNRYDIENLIVELTSVVEKEVEAFKTLLNGLMEHQTSIVKGSRDKVAESQQKVEKLVSETKKIKDELKNKKDDLAKVLNIDENLTITDMLSYVEGSYAARLNELKDMLKILSDKVSEANSRNQYLLDHSLRFVDNCIKTLIQGSNQRVAYDKEGTVKKSESSLFSGIG